MIKENQKIDFKIDRSQVDRQYTCSGGKGGQNVNRRSTCVILIHKPSGLIVRSEENRTQSKNEEAAWKRLEEKLRNMQSKTDVKEATKKLFDQIGFGNRSDKIRTYRIQDGFVLDHNTGKQITIKELYKGHLKKLHKE